MESQTYYNRGTCDKKYSNHIIKFACNRHFKFHVLNVILKKFPRLQLTKQRAVKNESLQTIKEHSYELRKPFNGYNYFLDDLSICRSTPIFIRNCST